jgi:hypothetical protein
MNFNTYTSSLLAKAILQKSAKFSNNSKNILRDFIL